MNFNQISNSLSNYPAIFASITKTQIHQSHHTCERSETVSRSSFRGRLFSSATTFPFDPCHTSRCAPPEFITPIYFFDQSVHLVASHRNSTTKIYDSCFCGKIIYTSIGECYYSCYYVPLFILSSP